MNPVEKNIDYGIVSLLEHHNYIVGFLYNFEDILEAVVYNFENLASNPNPIVGTNSLVQFVNSSSLFKVIRGNPDDLKVVNYGNFLQSSIYKDDEDGYFLHSESNLEQETMVPEGLFNWFSVEEFESWKKKALLDYNQATSVKSCKPKGTKSNDSKGVITKTMNNF